MHALAMTEALIDFAEDEVCLSKSNAHFMNTIQFICLFICFDGITHTCLFV
jgi:hypothetical protein